MLHFSATRTLDHLIRKTCLWAVVCVLLTVPGIAQQAPSISQMQTDAVNSKISDWGYWGPNAEKYSSWTNHSNRLIPVYTFGMKLSSASGENSVYRDKKMLKKLYGYLPTNTANPSADYFDQTDIHRLQQTAIEAGKKRVILFVCDGMDWQTTRAAAISKQGKVEYQEGKGTGLAFLDYQGTSTDYGFCVTSPHNDGTTFDVNKQKVSTPGGKVQGGYDVNIGGGFPWSKPTEADYPIGKSEVSRHAYTDSAASATSMTSGIKTYNKAINVDVTGGGVLPIARTLQDDGFAIGVVTSVPISHATPACAYSNNVTRNDYQDLTRDLIGLPSVFNPDGLPGVDVLLGAGWGVTKDADGSQGENFVPGNRYLTDADLHKTDVANGGKYVVAQRTSDVRGKAVLRRAAKQAKKEGHRLLGFFGAEGGHLPFRTADGNYDPVISVGDPEPKEAEVYSKADLRENVKLKDMVVTAADVLNNRSDQWWLMIECGDIDWANHANNIDNSIGAVLSGEAAFTSLVEWIEQNGGWDDTVVILTADHGHYLNLTRPEALIQNDAP